MNATDNPTNDDAMERWYRYAAEREGSVDSYLRVLRNQLGQNLDQQKNQFGVSDSEFNRLRGFRLPRSTSFVEDAKRIAEVCHLSHPNAFVKAMLVVHKVSQGASAQAAQQAFQAAFDDTDDLDELPKDE